MEQHGEMGSKRTEAAVDNERNETPGELNTGDRKSREIERGIESVEINKDTNRYYSGNNAALFSNCALITSTFFHGVEIDYRREINLKSREWPYVSWKMLN